MEADGFLALCKTKGHLQSIGGKKKNGNGCGAVSVCANKKGTKDFIFQLGTGPGISRNEKFFELISAQFSSNAPSRNEGPTVSKLLQIL